MRASQRLDDTLSKIWKQDSTWAHTAMIAKRKGYGSLYESMKQFLDTSWSLWFGNLVDDVSTLYEAPDDAISWILDQLHLVVYPLARSAGFPDSTFLLPDIAMDTLTGETAMDDVPPEFRACCSVCLSDDNVLTVACNWHGQQIEHSYDLNPIFASVADRILGGRNDVEISGLGDIFSDALNAVSSVLGDSGIRKLWDEVSPVVSLIPGANVAGGLVNAAFKAHDVLVKAKNGDKKAVKKIAEVKEAAKTDPHAGALLSVIEKLNNQINAKTATKTSGIRIGFNPFGSVSDFIHTFVPVTNFIPIPGLDGGGNNRSTTQRAMRRKSAPSVRVSTYDDPSQAGFTYDPSSGSYQRAKAQVNPYNSQYGLPPTPYSGYGAYDPYAYGYGYY